MKIKLISPSTSEDAILFSFNDSLVDFDATITHKLQKAISNAMDYIGGDAPDGVIRRVYLAAEGLECPTLFSELESDPDWTTGSVEVIVFGPNTPPSLRVEHKHNSEAFIEADMQAGE